MGCRLPGFNIPDGDSNLIANMYAPSNMVETARRHRWTLEFAVTDLSLPGQTDWTGTNWVTIFAHKATRPSLEIDSITVHHSQDEIYFPGKNRWAPIEISFYEILNNNGNETAKYIYDWWSKSVIDIDRSRIASSRDLGPMAKRQCKLTQIDGMGTPIYEYVLFGCWPEKITPDDLDYSDSAIGEISMRLRYDKCVETSMGGPQKFSPREADRIRARGQAERERIKAEADAAAYASSAAGRWELEQERRRQAVIDNARAR